MRNNRMVRVRRYDQRPQLGFGWADVTDDGGIQFYNAPNPYFRRDCRRQSWRRPL